MKLVTLVIAFLLLQQGICLAEKDGLHIEDSNVYIYELSADHDEQVWINRLSARNLWTYNGKNMRLELYPSFEIRRHFLIERWYASTLGAKIDIDVLKYLNPSCGIQYTWMDVPDGYFENAQRLNRDRVEINPALRFMFPLFKAGTIATYLSPFDEFFYDIQHGVPVRNEIGLGIIAHVNEYVDVGCAWRHMDWIKDFDADEVEVSVVIRI